MSHGFSVLKSDKSSDMYEHWDFKVNNSLVDVKGLKKVSRSDRNFSHDKTWVEFQNVRGSDGWLKCCSDFIAFEQVDHFLVVSREDLLNYCLDSVRQETVHISSEAFYKMYSRKGRRDVISLISLNEMKKSIKSWNFSLKQCVT